MKVLIVEDEDLAAEKLANMIALVDPETKILGCTSSIKDTVSWLKVHPQPELILMDIELSDGQSFEIFNQVNIDCPVIFTTSYDEFAIKAFHVNSIDYLLKPVLKEDLRRAFDKYKKLKTLNTLNAEIDVQKLLAELKVLGQPKDYRQRFLVKQGQKHVTIEIEHIAYFFVYERVVFFKTFENNRYILDYNLDELEAMLDPVRFFRVNRSFIIAIHSIHQLHDYINSRILLSLNPPIDEQIIVSREKVAAFKTWAGK